MNKPIVFFSHSSKDEKSMRRLKELIDLKTGKSVSIFLTSDGQSIPFGRNWVHKIEEALTQTSLMFVFVSPNSIQSNWIYFEAGYAYSKNIKVVPVGILGLDLAQIRPPLSLLQGFNLDKNDALGNILAVINETYQLTFDTTFDKEHFDYTFQDENINGSTDFLSRVRFGLQSENGIVFLHNISEKLKSLNLEFILTGNVLRSNGLEISTPDPKSPRTRIQIDGLLLHVYIPIILEVIKISGAEVESCRAELELNYRLILDSLRRSTLLMGTGIRAAEGEQLEFKGITFLLYRRIHPDSPNTGPVIIEIKTPNVFATVDWFRDLIRILCECGVVFEKQP